MNDRASEPEGQEHLGWTCSGRSVPRAKRRSLSPACASRGVRWAVERIHDAGGNLDIATLARELGHSHKHLIHQFHEHVGLPPRRLARLLRFDRAVQRLKAGGPVRWADFAVELGYFDQAHLNRDFRQFTGGPPSALLRRSLPDAGGFEAGAQVKSVQEGPGVDGQDAR